MMFDNIRQNNPEVRREIFRKKIENINGADKKNKKANNLQKNKVEIEEENGTFFDFKNVLKNFDFPSFEQTNKKIRKYNVSDYCSYINKVSKNIAPKINYSSKKTKENIQSKENIIEDNFNDREKYYVINDKNSKSTNNIIKNNLNLNQINNQEKGKEETDKKNLNFALNRDNFMEIKKNNNIEAGNKNDSSNKNKETSTEDVLKNKKLYANNLNKMEEKIAITENNMNFINKNTENKTNINHNVNNNPIKKNNEKPKGHKKKMNAFCSFFNLCFS